MVRVVLDTNILVSALLTPKGNPARIIDLAAEGALGPILSPAILAEYQNVLVRKKFGFTSHSVKMILDSLKRISVEVVPSESIHVCWDSADNKFVECAAAAGADFLITGNQRHFPKQFKSVRIVSPSEFLKSIGLPDR